MSYGHWERYRASALDIGALTGGLTERHVSNIHLPPLSTYLSPRWTYPTADLRPKQGAMCGRGEPLLYDIEDASQLIESSIDCKEAVDSVLQKRFTTLHSTSILSTSSLIAILSLLFSSRREACFHRPSGTVRSGGISNHI